MTDRAARAVATRRTWLETIERHCHDHDAPGSVAYWSPRLDTASRDEIRAIQDDKIRSCCEVRSAVEVLAPGTLPRTEFKAARGEGSARRVTVRNKAATVRLFG